MMSDRFVQIVLLLLISFSGARAQSVVDGSDAAIDAESVRAVLTLIGQHLRSPDAKVTALRTGRAGALCGAVDVRNRMGTYTGPRGFVVVLPDNFIGRLPEGPELLNPASVADYRTMERAKSLYETNCSIP